MSQVLDLYVKLLIGTFSFIGPSFTLLISIFYGQLNKSLGKRKAQLANLEKLSKFVEPFEDVSSKDVENFYQKHLNSNKREINLLNPKRQIRRIFISLAAAIILVGLYYFQIAKECPFVYNLTIGRMSILVSLLSFGYTLFTLWQVFCIVIKSKADEEKRKLAVEEQQLPESISLKSS